MSVFRHFIWFISMTTLFSVSTQADDLVFKKQLLDKQMLLVHRHETPVVPPSKETLKLLPPGISLTKPDHVYLYSFVLASPGQKDITVWEDEVNEFDGFETLYGRWKVFDAAIEAKNLIVTFKDEGDTYAYVFTPDSKGKYQAMRWQDAILQSDNATFGPISTAAAITGSLKAGTLGVVITNVASAEVLKKMGGDRIQYSLKEGKWVKIGPVPPPQPAVLQPSATQPPADTKDQK